MKKKNLLIFSILFLLLGLIVYKNRSYPKKSQFEEYALKDRIKADNFTITVNRAYVCGKNPQDYPILAVDFTVENTGDKVIDVSDLDHKFNLYQNFAEGIGQNIDHGFDENVFDKLYKKEDFKLAGGEKKNFTFKYYIDKEKRPYKNFIFLDNSYYKDQYERKLKEGLIYYKIIDLGDIYD